MLRHQRMLVSLLPLGGIVAMAGLERRGRQQQQQQSLASCEPSSHPSLTCQIERQNGRTVVFRDKQMFLQKRAAFIEGYGTQCLVV